MNPIIIIIAILLLSNKSNSRDGWTYDEVEKRLKEFYGITATPDRVNVLTNKANHYLSYNGGDKYLSLEQAMAEFGML